ncbi:unnamed protein product [Rotaria sordida]|uniref:Uncharacterized protein n=1 Tax=Rotaria sordida TaxID=392033 RepID=A0A815PTZ0_9BILA|nr:unnamed protein product [Rotaria sordida]CAF4124987.1 unnamed protein product [Rotaria sordida]
MYTGNKLNLPLTEDIQRTFTDFRNTEIISYVDYFPEEKLGRCRIYSYPSFIPYYGDITNNFPEEFLFDTKTYFQNNILRIKCESLQRVTHHFTRDATRINCAKINELELSDGPICSDSLQQYFPYARISYPLII